MNPTGNTVESIGLHAPSREWPAELALRFARADGATRLVAREHRGPLVVQKPLYPEDAALCQTLLVHPPGGLAGGDRLALDLEVGKGAQVQVVTPGATKWYRCTDLPATFAVTARVDDEAALEWLPQESIVFDGAHARMSTAIALAGRAVYVGWELTVLGRAAAGEHLRRGELRQRIELVRDGALVWTEQGVTAGDAPLLHSPLGLAGYPVVGTLVVSTHDLDATLVSRCRAVGSDLALADRAVTQVPAVLIARCRAQAIEPARAWFIALWRVLRPAVLGRDVVLPRIWST